jgi:hypothetical protein
MQVIKTLRNIEFGSDPYELYTTPPAIERYGRVYAYSLEVLRHAHLELRRSPESAAALDMTIDARDRFIFADGALWELMRARPHQAFRLEDGNHLWMSEARGTTRPHLILADAEGRRQCPSCYGVGQYRTHYPDAGTFAPCPLCLESGSLTVSLPACCRKEELAHVD